MRPPTLWTTNEQGQLHRGQARAWRSLLRFVFVIAGTQSGKTSFGPWWLHREIESEQRAGDYLAVTASYDLFKLKMLPEIRTVFEHVLRIGRWWAGDKILELSHPQHGFLAKRSDDPMHGRIILRSAGSSGGLESATAKAAWLDECGQDAFTLEDWNAVQARLSLCEGRCLGTTTPYNLGWLKTEVYDRWKRGDPDIEVVNFASALNPAFPDREQTRREETMQDWRFVMRYLGQFTKPAGLIYSVLDPSMIVEPFLIPDEWERLIGVDFGGANTAALYLAQNPDTRQWIAYDEMLTGDKTSKEYAQEVLGRLPEDCSFTSYGGSKSEGQQRRDWADGGLALGEPPISDVESGIDRTTEWLKTGKLVLLRSCAGLIDEFGTYRRKLDSLGEPTDKIDNKRAFHRLDALRYSVVGAGHWDWLDE
jgi:hypothetical protein